MVSNPILSQMYQILAFHSAFKITLNIILTSAPRSSKCSLSFKSQMPVFAPVMFTYSYSEQATGKASSVLALLTSNKLRLTWSVPMCLSKG